MSAFAALIRRARSKIEREAAKRLAKRTALIAPTEPLISFTFDDFPATALHTGGRILRAHGLFGTYYVSLGIAGQDSPSGRAFDHGDLEDLLSKGHELGCHTFDHLHSTTTSPTEFEASVLKNQQTLARMHPSVRMRSHSYPIGCPRIGTKLKLAKLYSCSRGGGQSLNQGWSDLNYLSAFFLEKTRGDLQPVYRMIDQNRISKGWLIFATHDIASHPSEFGCSPTFFSQVVDYAIKSNARICPVSEALSRAIQA